MRLKSRYRRQYRDGGRVDELPTERPIEAAPETPPAPPVESQPEPPALPQPEPPPPASDDATAALRRQIDGLRQSEALRQQHQQQMHDAMHAAKGRRDAWLESTPGAKQNIEALGHFHHVAIRNGLIDTSPEYFRFMEDQLAALQQPAEAATHLHKQAAHDMQTPTPAFFAPPAGPPARSAPNPSSLVSAPVSREIPTSSGERFRPRGQVKLTPQEVEAARISGISPEDYARQKVLYEGMREDGSYRDNRGQGS